MKKLVCAFLLMAAQYSYASFHYCTGTIDYLVTRASSEETQVTLNGMTGSARLNYGGATYSEMHNRQFSMLLAAYMSGKSVRLEFANESGFTKCSDDHSSKPIRFVLLN